MVAANYMECHFPSISSGFDILDRMGSSSISILTIHKKRTPKSESDLIMQNKTLNKTNEFYQNGGWVMKNRKQNKIVVTQITLAVLASLMCVCLVYGYSGFYIDDSVSDMMVQFMATGIIVLTIGSIAMSIFVSGKIRWVWIVVSIVTVAAIVIVIRELNNLKLQFKA